MERLKGEGYNEILEDSQHIEVQSPRLFLRDFANHIKLLGTDETIFAQAMYIIGANPGSALDELYKSFISASHRGVRVVILPDYYTEMMPGKQPRWVPKTDAVREQQKLDYAFKKELSAANPATLSLEFTHVPQGALARFGNELVPQASRSHMKIYLAGKQAGWIGGYNLQEIEQNEADCMVKIHDKKTLSLLHDVVARNRQGRRTTDEVITLPHERKLLLDGGERGTSCIYEAAVNQIQKAKGPIRFASQLSPDGRLLEAIIVKAQSGIPVEIVLSSHEDRFFKNFPYVTSYISMRKRIKGIEPIQLYHYPGKMHMKYLQTPEAVMVGSHNLVTQGVTLGTAENMMVFQRDEDTQVLAAYYETIRDRWYTDTF